MNDQHPNTGDDYPTPETEVTSEVTIADPPPRPRTPRATLVATGGRALAIIPRTFEEAWRIAQMATVAGWAPRGWRAEQAAAAIMHGAEVGLPPMMSLQKICVINGRPSLWGDAVPAIAMATGELEDWHEEITGDGDAMVATCTVKRRRFKTPTVRSFSAADAKNAGLWEKAGPWTQYRKRMLQMRARVAFRDAFADAFAGLYLAEEMQDREFRTPSNGGIEDIGDPLGNPDQKTVPAAGQHEAAGKGKAGGAASSPSPATTADTAFATAKAAVEAKQVAQGPAIVQTDIKPQTRTPDTPATAGGQAAGASSPGPVSGDPPAEKTNQEAPAAASDADPVFPKPYIQRSGHEYVDYVRAWTAQASIAADVRERYRAERDIRNNLGKPMNEDEREIVMGLVDQAEKRLGTP